MLTWLKVFYWMKLFKTPAFFINLLSETFVDDNFKAFCIMTLVLVVMVSNVYFIMNQERGSAFLGKNSDSVTLNEELYSKNLDDGFVNAFIYTYLIALGDFTTKTYIGANDEVLWIFFLGATFML